MTMAEEIDSIYMTLNELLNDICKFLDNEVNKEVLSPEARKQANLLINRSKKQITVLENECKTGGYLPMDRKMSELKEPSLISNNILSTSRSVLSLEISDRYFFASDLPARSLPSDSKNGTLSWKIKIFFGFERMQKIFAGIFENYLLVYRCEKDLRPIHIYNLVNHKASPMSDNDDELRFLLLNNKSNLIYQFMAQTNKDMMQWVIRINKSHQNVELKKIEPIRDSEGEASAHSEEDEAEYDIIINGNQQKSTTNIDSPEEEQFYEDVEARYHPSMHTQIEVKPSIQLPPIQLPPMPNRMQRTPLPPLPVEERSSFSEDEDAVYDVLSGPPPEGSQPQMPPSIQDSVSPPKPVLVAKPTISARPKIDVKIITHSPYGKYSTKKIMKIVQESSLKK